MKCSKHNWTELQYRDEAIIQWCKRCGTVRKRAQDVNSWEYYRPTRTYPKRKKLPPMPPTMACVWVLYTAKGQEWGGDYESLNAAIADATESIFKPGFSVARFDRVSGSTHTYYYATTEFPKNKTDADTDKTRWLLYDSKGEVFGSGYVSRQDAWSDVAGPRFRPRFRITKYVYAKGTKRHYKYKG